MRFYVCKAIKVAIVLAQIHFKIRIYQLYPYIALQ